AKPVTTAKPDSAAGKLAQLGARKDSTGGDTSGLAGTQADQARQNPLFAVLAPATYQAENGQPALRPGPVVGYAAQKDTAKVNAYLSSPAVQALIPRNLKLLWGVKPISAESKVLELYALKSSGFNGEAAMAGDVITDARSDVDQNNNP